MDKIYIVEDDENIRNLIIYALKSANFEAFGFSNSKELYKRNEIELASLYILDIMLDEEDGYTILSKLKKDKLTSNIPVIMLTAKTAEYEKVKGLDMGADDYITKPFSVLELISRIKAVLRRVNSNKDDNISFKEISMNLEKRLVYINNKEVELTFKEFELLNYFLNNIGIVLSRDQIMSEVWDFDYTGESRTVDAHVGSLRSKLEDYGKYIITIRNVGYKLGD